MEGRYPEKAAAYSVAVGCDLAGMTARRRLDALDEARKAMTPPSAKDAAKWISALHAATAHRREDDTATALALDLYVAALCRWPADVAKNGCLNLALRAAPDGPNWFPTLGELEAECERLGSSRRILVAALEAWSPEPSDAAEKRTLHDRAHELRRRAKDLHLAIPMSYRAHTPRSQWDGIYAQKAAEAEACEREAYDLEAEARTGQKAPISPR